VSKQKLPPDVVEFFRKQGSKGGKKAAAGMTPEARIARAKKAAAALTAEQRSERARKAIRAYCPSRKQKGPSDNKKNKTFLFCGRPFGNRRQHGDLQRHRSGDRS
jgi:hypothetical protein